MSLISLEMDLYLLANIGVHDHNVVVKNAQKTIKLLCDKVGAKLGSAQTMLLI